MRERIVGIVVLLVVALVVICVLTWADKGVATVVVPLVAVVGAGATWLLRSPAASEPPERPARGRTRAQGGWGHLDTVTLLLLTAAVGLVVMMVFVWSCASAQRVTCPAGSPAVAVTRLPSIGPPAGLVTVTCGADQVEQWRCTRAARVVCTDPSAPYVECDDGDGPRKLLVEDPDGVTCGKGGVQ